MANNEIILEMKDIVKVFPGVRALDGAQLTIKKGQVHALIGENGAGKSTLMKVLLGIYQEDEGEVIFHGKPAHFKSPHAALSAGISMIHQEISLIPSTDVSENVWIGREKNFTTMGILSKSKRVAATQALLDELNIQINPKTIVRSLNVANMQLVEIARAVSYDADIIIMDEPTSSLTDSEVELLYKIIRGLSAKGTAVIFISHKLEEIFEICDHVTVMRDGKYISDHPTSEVTKDKLVTLIAGREISQLFPKEEAEIKDPVLEVRNLCSDRFHNVSFKVHEGEILGFSGLVGAGRTEIMRAVFGIDKCDSGQIFLNGKEIKINSPKDAIAHGLGMVTEDRRADGIISPLPVSTNISLAYLPKIAKAGFVEAAQETQDAQEMVKKLDVRTSSLKKAIGALSGGNQQKAIIARWLLTNPKVMILDEPTRGIDVGSKSEIHRLISQLAKQGMAVIMISSEMPEILGMSDRIIVVRDGELVASVDRKDATQELLLQYAFGTAAESAS